MLVILIIIIAVVIGHSPEDSTAVTIMTRRVKINVFFGIFYPHLELILNCSCLFGLDSNNITITITTATETRRSNTQREEKRSKGCKFHAGRVRFVKMSLFGSM
jgi:hypothetical protein